MEQASSIREACLNHTHQLVPPVLRKLPQQQRDSPLKVRTTLVCSFGVPYVIRKPEEACCVCVRAKSNEEYPRNTRGALFVLR